MTPATPSSSKIQFTFWGWIALVIVALFLAAGRRTGMLVVGILSILILVVILVNTNRVQQVFFKGG